MPTEMDIKWRHPNRGALQKATLRRIKIALKMGSDMPFPKCNRRNKRKARELADKGETYHLKSQHVCEKCRCDRTAGQSTWGWWYWAQENELNLPEVGHLGVGPCYWHGQGFWAKQGFRGIGDLDVQVRKEIDIMREMGHAPDDGGRWLINLANENQVALVRNDIANATAKVRDDLSQLEKELANGTPLTERGGKDGAMPLTDASRYKLKLALAKGMSDLAKTEWLASQDDYIHRDEMIRFVHNLMQMSEKFITEEDEWKNYVAQFKQLMLNVRSGKPTQ